MKTSTISEPEPYTNLQMTKLWPDWHEDAACTDIGYELFFGPDSDKRPALTVSQIRQVRGICESCPVFKICLDHALRSNEEYGIWAGTTGRARRKIQRRIRSAEVTVDQVVTDYLNGERRKYERGGEPGAPRRRVREVEGLACLPVEDGRAQAS